MRVSLTVNGTAVTADVEPRLQLVDFLRENLLLTGTHIGCEHGVCGACTILLDGAPARSCIAYAAACEGAAVCTIEGLEDDPAVRRLRAAFSAEHALQCGYCTPGMLVTARDIVLRLPDADASRIRLELAGNLCRCTGYAGIVRAIERVVREGPREPAVTEAVPSAIAPARSAAPLPIPVCHAAGDTPMAGDERGATPVVTVDAGSAGGEAEPSLILRIPIPRPRSEVWSALHDPALLATCIPGARLISAAEDRIEGEMHAALGPITVVFAGSGRLAFDDAAYRATLGGAGNDRRSATRLSASAVVTLTERDTPATEALIEIRYALRGPLAQLARPAIVEAFAGSVARSAAGNLERRLAGEPVADNPAGLPLGALLVRIIRERLTRWLHPR